LIERGACPLTDALIAHGKCFGQLNSTSLAHKFELAWTDAARNSWHDIALSSCFALLFSDAPAEKWVGQKVRKAQDQGIRNAWVGGSIPSCGTNKINILVGEW
jgi:hypothetical protein